MSSELKQLFRTKKTQIEIARDRGFSLRILDRAILSWTFGQFNEYYTNILRGGQISTIRQALGTNLESKTFGPLIYYKPAFPNESLLIHYGESSSGVQSFSSDEVKKFLTIITLLQNEGKAPSQAILIGPTNLASPSQKLLDEALSDTDVHFFTEQDLQSNVTHHYLFSKHELLIDDSRYIKQLKYNGIASDSQVREFNLRNKIRSKDPKLTADDRLFLRNIEEQAIKAIAFAESSFMENYANVKTDQKAPINLSGGLASYSNTAQAISGITKIEHQFFVDLLMPEYTKRSKFQDLSSEGFRLAKPRFLAIINARVQVPKITTFEETGLMGFLQRFPGAPIITGTNLDSIIANAQLMKWLNSQERLFFGITLNKAEKDRQVIIDSFNKALLNNISQIAVFNLVSAMVSKLSIEKWLTDLTTKIKALGGTINSEKIKTITNISLPPIDVKDSIMKIKHGEDLVLLTKYSDLTLYPNTKGVALLMNKVIGESIKLPMVKGIDINLLNQNDSFNIIYREYRTKLEQVVEEYNKLLVGRFTKTELTSNDMQFLKNIKNMTFDSLDDSPRSKFLNQSGLQLAHLPIIRSKDPVSKYYGFKAGQIIRIYRNLSLETLVSNMVVYRLVLD